MLAISDKVVIRADDLLSWYDSSINWQWGLSATTKKTADIKRETDAGDRKLVCTESESKSTCAAPFVRSLKNSHLDFTDIEQEKGTISGFLKIYDILLFLRF